MTIVLIFVPCHVSIKMGAVGIGKSYMHMSVDCKYRLPLKTSLHVVDMYMLAHGIWEGLVI